ncbi:MAG: TauD/TfdA family dioxygenase [Actinobacteria bacterium]|nr:TauD/TfdA family dioxygenase [Actinomycetota bacterium]
MSNLPIVAPTARTWRGSELSDTSIWTRIVTASERLGLNGDAGDSSADTSDAQDLADEIRSELIHGRGFVLLKGLFSASGDMGEAADVFVRLGQRLGSLRSQNAAGDLLGHVKDVGRDLDDPTARIYQTNARQTFHTDSADAVGLLCIRPAAEGGRSMLVSVETIYEEMRRTKPHLAAWMFEPLATDRRGEIPDGRDPWFEIPVLSWHEGQLSCLYQRQYIDSAARFPDASPLDPEHRDALDEFDRLANRPDLHMVMDLEPGDVQLVHNHGLLHDRTSWIDDPTRPRHLLRLWVSLAGDRSLPPVYEQRYGSIVVGDRGGIVVR